MKPNLIIYKKYRNINIWQELISLLKRLYIQTYRKPINFLTSILQPTIWLILFGALFRNAPVSLSGNYNVKYIQFLSYGTIIFSAFTSAINAGLPVIFDREFGFFNRLIISPLAYKTSIFMSIAIHTLNSSVIQNITILSISMYLTNETHLSYQVFMIIIISAIITLQISNLSIAMSFILPGHVEFLGLILITNLPILFSSTALAPLSFMPYWLQIISCMNPLTYAIEIIRHISIYNHITLETSIINTIWFTANTKNSLCILILTNIISIYTIKQTLRNKYN
uniref:ABC transmembrane type-2 domain-containing protein n=1 Tax=Platysiphonia delicata TaxID=2006979 RepID=A0A1Z1M0R5_9FLOR|nr:hypothetical protein [Platysiphonia delicata]ARW59656.1 hypothetical protein [Platysiphonia delicata]